MKNKSDVGELMRCLCSKIIATGKDINDIWVVYPKERWRKMMENKVEFVKSLEACIRLSREFGDLDRLEYEMTDGFEEYVYIIYKNNAKKRICVTADSCMGILYDFVSQYSKAPYI